MSQLHAPMVSASCVLLAGAVLAAVVACAAAPGSPSATQGRVPTGTWGGLGMRLDVAESGDRVEFDCAHGTIEPLVVDSENRFDVGGTLVFEHGGPIREGERELSEPARYSGRLSGDTLTLTVTPTKTGESAGTFTATLGQAPRLRKCL